MGKPCDHCEPNLPPGRGYMYAITGGTLHHLGQCRGVKTPWLGLWCDRTPPRIDLTEDFDLDGPTGPAMRDVIHEPEDQPFPEDAPGYKRPRLRERPRGTAGERLRRPQQAGALLGAAQLVDTVLRHGLVIHPPYG